MFLKKTVYVFEIVGFFGRTTADVHALVNCYAPFFSIFSLRKELLFLDKLPFFTGDDKTLGGFLYLLSREVEELFFLFVCLDDR